MVATPYTDPVMLSNAPLSLLPPDIAGQVEALRYVWAGTAAVFIWDVLNNLKADYDLLFNYKIRWPVVAYFMSRIVCLVYVIGFTIFLTYPVGGCRVLDLVLDSLYPIAVPATSFLFFFRVRAIYAGNRTVTIVFSLLWLAELAACITVPFGTGGANIGTTPYCIIAELAPYTGAAAITPTVFDTAVFVAISYRLVGNTHLKYSWREMCRALVSSAALPAFSKALFRDGQVYYILEQHRDVRDGVRARRQSRLAQPPRAVEPHAHERDGVPRLPPHAPGAHAGIADRALLHACPRTAQKWGRQRLLAATFFMSAAGYDT